MAIIFFDIDGTLAMGTHVPQSAADAIARTRAAGNLVFICTGRPRWYAQRTFGEHADGFVCCNGRLAVQGEECLMERPIDSGTVREIVTILDSHVAGYAFLGERQAFYGGNQEYRSVAEWAHGETIDMAEALEQDVPLFCFDIFFGTPAEREVITQALEGICLVNPHGPHPSADVTVLGYGKGDAVRDTIAALGIAWEDSYAFGDGINDISMLEAACHGVAMGNAVSETKAVAEYVTSDINEDGVARALVHYGLA